MAKKIGLQSKDIASLDKEFKDEASKIDPAVIFADIKNTLNQAISNKKYDELLLYFDDKGLLAEAAKLLCLQKKPLEEYIGRSLRGEGHKDLLNALLQYLPKVQARPTA